jgi:hypothetical protein
LHDHAQRANWIGSVWNYQLRHEPELDCGYSSRKLYDQQLQNIAERNLDWNRKRHLIRRERPCSFDHL